TNQDPGMKILLRDFQTGLYLGRGREWTQSPEKARAFPTRLGAGAYRMWHRLPRACVVAVPNQTGTSHRTHVPVRNQSRPATDCAAVLEAKLELSPNNSLFIRGEGGGLSWQEGQALRQIDSQTWVWVSHARSERIVFQLLLNDLIWAKGEDRILVPGGRLKLTPDFDWPEIPRFASSDDAPGMLRAEEPG
ncbi:MAG TPA: hypothetical protein VHI52_13495, partial [Verrucomicrobiae bacterium]|nr:hypothetical protein [Verrucomicrobiae bacterium]